MDKVKTVIDKWDPIGLLPFCPDDEYEFEIKRICECMNSTITVEMLAEKIHLIFSSAFGASVFKSNIKECRKVAKLILKQSK